MTSRKKFRKKCEKIPKKSEFREGNLGELLWGPLGLSMEEKRLSPESSGTAANGAARLGPRAKLGGGGGIPGLFWRLQKTKSRSSERIGPILGHRVEGIGAKTFPSLIGIFGILLTLGKNR